jgi:hypothetical protein
MASETPRPVTGNTRAFRVLVRNAMFRRVELAAFGRWTELAALDPDGEWDETAWMEAMAAYREEYPAVTGFATNIGTGPGSRGPELFMVEEGPATWTVRQTFDDPEGDRDWGITATVDLAESDEIGEAAVTVVSVGPR